MPIRSSWKLAREGVTADTLGTVLHYTALNPAFTLPLLLLARYTAQGNAFAAAHTAALKQLKTLVTLGVLRQVSSWLDDKVLNNWSSDKYDWEKEVVVVTGGSDGIGACIVKLLAERQIKVVVLDVQEPKYEAPPTVRYVHCDLASPTSITAAASETRSHFGPPTILINNAGVARGKPILSTTASDLRLTFAVNTQAHFLLTQAFLPSMIHHNHGMIVTVASLAGYVTAPNMVDYAGSKAAAIAFHEGLSAELASIYKADRVRTVLMCQGYTRTPLFEGFDTAALYPETVAEGIVKAVYSGKSGHLVLPESQWLMTPKIRGWPFWMQYGMRKRLDNLMKKWSGRQVAQPSEKGEKGGKEEVEGSTVFVEGEK